MICIEHINMLITTLFGIMFIYFFGCYVWGFDVSSALFLQFHVPFVFTKIYFFFVSFFVQLMIFLIIIIVFIHVDFFMSSLISVTRFVELFFSLSKRFVFGLVNKNLAGDFVYLYLF